MGFLFSSGNKYQAKKRNQYIEYSDGTCVITCSCGDVGPIIDVDSLDSFINDSEVKTNFICVKCHKPLLADLKVYDSAIAVSGDLL